ncbi:PREDICTED: interactor of constitutive active ROPs 3-like [Fragaria vesca subsp. vesca]|uniref:interactor of constitutive active ROPs 3 n=1 Tax=Fragaria vesca subsp. vesca TaxID=101020 RepID=UPI0002C2FCA2|nr:PREDICTED: interactor of constitutive active ROPs 3 [Fragaria vesca subsp. vesca]XP_011461347.1 PREDICTED: interactor of constitutive active ROPs 3 [Fragaria vesca subsp. vesca]XP_011461348.1 PREDICTED: interactor of constitutive active ROPs 3 [Fragaria vesca subsp. vesca]XP_011461349.1 PREDICTED: interactor of constitutive active ROPs 3 [Fragaria vesca subsp. vesca]
MQTPKARSGASEVPQRVSPTQRVTPPLRVSPTQKDSPRVVRRQLKPTALETDPASTSNQARRLSKDRSPKVNERRSPRSPLPEKKGPSRVSELESQITQLQEDLKKANNELQSSESCKKQAQQDAEESKKQFLALSSKLEESQQQIPDLCISEEARVIKLQKISQEKDQAWQSELEAVQKQHSVDAAALASAIDEIERLKLQLEMVAVTEADQTKHAESVNVELQSLKVNLAETLSLVENMKNELNDCKEAEAQAQAQVSQTLLQLESARRTVETLSSDGMKAMEAYNSVASELDQSKARVNSLEEIVAKLKADLDNVSSNNDLEREFGEKHESMRPNEVEAELYNLKSEVKRLKSTLETAETKYHEEQIQSTAQIRSAHELVEQMRSASSQREDELEDELKRTKAGVEALKAHLMDKETELQCISEENEGLNVKLQQSLSCQREYELEKEVKELTKLVSDLKAHVMDKETELQSISEENEMLRVEINKTEMDKNKANEEVVAEVQAARCAEREALMKLGIVMEEADKSSKKVARVTEQLEAAQAASAELEAELRKLKVQSGQWRKAAEAAAAILSSGNGKIMERTVSMDSNYHVPGKLGSPYSEDMDDEMLKKKNGNMLKKIGVFWKKPQK